MKIVKKLKKLISYLLNNLIIYFKTNEKIQILLNYLKMFLYRCKDKYDQLDKTVLVIRFYYFLAWYQSYIRRTRLWRFIILKSLPVNDFLCFLGEKKIVPIIKQIYSFFLLCRIKVNKIVTSFIIFIVTFFYLKELLDFLMIYLYKYIDKSNNFKRYTCIGEEYYPILYYRTEYAAQRFSYSSFFKKWYVLKKETITKRRPYFIQYNKFEKIIYLDYHIQIEMKKKFLEFIKIITQKWYRWKKEKEINSLLLLKKIKNNIIKPILDFYIYLIYYFIKILKAKKIIYYIKYIFLECTLKTDVPIFLKKLEMYYYKKWYQIKLSKRRQILEYFFEINPFRYTDVFQKKEQILVKSSRIQIFCRIIIKLLIKIIRKIYKIILNFIEVGYDVMVELKKTFKFNNRKNLRSFFYYEFFLVFIYVIKDIIKEFIKICVNLLLFIFYFIFSICSIVYLGNVRLINSCIKPRHGSPGDHRLPMRIYFFFIFVLFTVPKVWFRFYKTVRFNYFSTFFRYYIEDFYILGKEYLYRQLLILIKEIILFIFFSFFYKISYLLFIFFHKLYGGGIIQSYEVYNDRMSKINIALIENSSKQNLFPGDYSGTIYYYIYNFFKDYKGGTSIRNFMYDLNFWLVGVFRFFIAIYRCFLKFKKDFMFLFKKEYFPIFYKYSVHEDAKKYITPEEYNSSFINKTLFIKPFGSFYIKCKERAVIYKEIIDWNDELHVAFFVPMNKKISSGYYTSWMYNIFLPYKIAHLFYQSLCAHIGKAIRISYEYDRYKREERRSPTYFGKIGTIDYTYSYPYGRPETTPDRTPVFFSEVEHYVGFFLYDIWNKHRKYTRKINIFKANCFYFFYEICSISLKYLSLIVYIIPLFPILLKVFYFIRNEWRLNAGAYYLDEYDTSDRSKRWRYAEVRSVSGFASFIRRILEFIGRIIRNNSEIFYFIINIFIIIIKKSYEYIKFLIKFIIKKSFKFFLFLCKLILLKPLIFFGNLYSIKKFRYLIGRVLSANIQGGTIFNEFIRAIRIVEYDLWTYPKKDIAFMNACRFDPIYNPNRWIDDVSYEISREIGWQTDYFISFVFDANFLEDMLYHDEDATWWDLMDDGDEHEEEPYALIYRYWDTELQWPNYEADGLRDFIDLFYSEHIDGITEYFADVNREARQHRARVLPYSDAYVNYYRAWLKYMRNYTYLHYTMLVEQDRINWLILCFLFLCCTAMWDPLFNERVFDLHWYSMMSDVFGYNLTYDNVLSFKLFEVLVPEKIRDLITSFDVLTERTWYAKYFFALNKYRQHLIHEMYTTKVAPGVVFADTIYGFVFVKVLAALPLPMVSFKSYGTMNLWDNFYISRENFSGFKQALPYMFDSSGRYVIVYDEFRHFDWTDFPRWNNRPTFFDGIQGYMRDYMPRNVFYDFFSGCDREQAFSTVNTWNRRLSAKSDAIKFVMPRLSETIANKDPAFDYILRKSNELFFSLRKDLRLQYYLSNMFSRKNAYNDEYNVLLTSRDQVLEPIMQNYTNINKYLRSFYWKPKNILYDILVKYDRTGIGIYLLGFDKYSIFQNPYKGKCVESFMTHPYAYDAGRMKNWYSDYSPYYNRDSIDSICRYRQTYYKDMRLIDPILNKKYFHYPLKNVGTPFIDLNKKLFMFSPYLDQYFYNQIKSTPIYISPFGEIYLHPIAYHINLDNLRVGKHNYDFIRYDLSSSYAYNKAYKAYLSSIFNHKYLRMRDLDYEYDINSICSDAIKKEFKLKLKQHLINFRDLKNNKIHQFAQNLDSIYEPISHRFFGNEVQQLNTGLARSADEIRALCSGRGEDILDDYLQKSRDFTDFFDAVLRYCKDCVYLTLNYYNIPAKLPLTFTFSFSLSDFEFRGQEIAEQLMSYLIRREAGVEDALLKTPENPEEVLEEMYDEEFNNILDFYEDYLHPLSKYYKRKETVNYLYKNYPNFVENLFPYSNKWHKTKEIGSRNAFLLSDFLRFKERVAYWDVDFVRTPRNKLKNYYNLLLLNYRDVDNLNTVASFIEDKKFDVVVKHLGRSGKNYLTFKRGLEYFINEPMTVNNLFEKMLENDAVLSSSKNFWDHFSHGDELNNFGQNRYIKEFGIESYNQFFDFKNLESMYLNDLSAGQRYRALKKNYYN